MLTFDEQNLLSIYSAQTSGRTETIETLEEMIPHLEADELELRTLCQDVITKLRNMTDAEYQSLDLMPGI